MASAPGQQDKQHAQQASPAAVQSERSTEPMVAVMSQSVEMLDRAAYTERLERENAELKAQIAQAKAQRAAAAESQTDSGPAAFLAQHGLSKEQVERYSRQMILPSFGAAAQGRLSQASVLVVGAGGLGSPACLYLAAAGVGRLGIVDKDSVELSNLHRQIAHCEERVGVHKALSAAAACRVLNSTVQVEPWCEGLLPSNALDLVEKYDVVVDASDNAPTRYLLSDACALARRPLVSGAAIGMDGQLTVYCHGETGPCYRCMFPECPQAGACASCSDAGVLGVVPGIVGCLQALEAVKLAAQVGSVLSQRMLLFDGAESSFRSVKLRVRSATCAACGSKPSITADSLPGYDYAAFTGQQPNDKGPPPRRLLPAEERLAGPAFVESVASSPQQRPLLVDVRPPEQYAMAALPGSLSMPFDSSNPAAFLPHAQELQRLVQRQGTDSAGKPARVHVVCRRGNDSQLVVDLLRRQGISGSIDLIGGLQAWTEQDRGFPLY